MSKIIADCSREENYSIAVIDNFGDLDYFSFESCQKKTIKSNIYLGRITRVEYSLQAAFVEYGEKKAGFLPFAEIHPNYYQIPTKDKQELLKFLKKENNEEEGEDENKQQYFVSHKKYSIQEVIKRGQTVLVQVTKDERGNKGVSLSTYISLAGRYCVFMPNSNNGIGVSKKIFSYEDRKKILNAVKELKVKPGAGVIFRTACIKAEKEDLKNDYQYLVNLWDEICNKTVHSQVGDNAIYTELNIVEQIIRDNYESDTNSAIIIKGEKGYNEALSFVKKIMPREVNKVILYKDKTPIFKKYEIDKKLDRLLEPNVALPSGGYLVINPTEALISIDVNSGKSIHSKDVEETALATNLEAAKEVARQLKLRNLGGLVVVDFIDMNEAKNRHILEKELQKVFASDKARVQVAKISQFGLVEISRQRLRSSINEMITIPCEHCNGTGLVKAPSMVSIDILDSIDEALQNNKTARKEFLEVIARTEVINYFVVTHIKEIEQLQKKYNIKIVTTKHPFGRNEEYILRALDKIGDSNTATELYHAIVAKFEVATAEKREKNRTFRALGKILKVGKIFKKRNNNKKFKK